MHTQPRKLLLAAGIALALTTLGANAADNISRDVLDARQETQIWTTYALSPHLRANDLKVSVNNGKATLSGRVAEDVNKELARQIALGVTGISEVDNQIVVQHDYTPPAASPTRGYGDIIDDVTITSTVKSKLLWSKYADGLATDVETKRGQVTLQGTADSKVAREIAGNLALNTRGVVSVSNQLVIKPMTPTAAETIKSTASVAGREISDSWITAKIKSTFLYSSDVDGSLITVSTSKGMVVLSGKVESSAERALAIELAKNVRGVKGVQSRALKI